MTARNLSGALALLGLSLTALTAPRAESFSHPYAASFQTVRVPLAAIDEDMLERGAAGARISIAWMNVWSISNDGFLIDGEETQAEVALRYQLSRHLQVGAALPYLVQSGGFMDASIEAFHRATRVTQGERDRYPRNTVNVSYELYGPYYWRIDADPTRTLLRRILPRPYPRQLLFPSAPAALEQDDPLFTAFLIAETDSLVAEEVVRSGDSAAGPGDVRAFAQWRVFSGGGLLEELRLGLQGRAPAATGDLHGSLGRALSASVALRTRLGAESDATSLSVGASWTVFDQRRYRGLILPATQWTLRLRAEQPIGDWKLFAEYFYFTRPVENLSRLARDGHQIGLGFVYDSGDWRFQAGLTENLINFGVTPDVGVGFSCEMRFDPATGATQPASGG
jgi:hypothetical protein